MRPKAAGQARELDRTFAAVSPHSDPTAREGAVVAAARRYVEVADKRPVKRGMSPAMAMALADMVEAVRALDRGR